MTRPQNDDTNVLPEQCSSIVTSRRRRQGSTATGSTKTTGTMSRTALSSLRMVAAILLLVSSTNIVSLVGGTTTTAEIPVVGSRSSIPARINSGTGDATHDRDTGGTITGGTEKPPMAQTSTMSNVRGGGAEAAPAVQLINGNPENERPNPQRLLSRNLHEDLHDPHVRRNVVEIEQSTQRYKTGTIDPRKFDLVKYENHPMQAWADDYRRRLRQLQEEHGEEGGHERYWDEVRRLKEEEDGARAGQHRDLLATTNNNNLTKADEGRKLQDDNGSPFRPLRIRYYTEELEAANAPLEKIEFVKNTILPMAADFWSSALAVVPVSGFLKIDDFELVGNGQYCGDSEFTRVPSGHMTDGIPDTDLILYVSATPSSRFCGSSTLAVAVSCNHDGYDRPVAGAINVCLDTVETDGNGMADDATIQDNLDVVIHEIGHVLAMSSNHFPHFRFSNGTPRTNRNWSAEPVTCVNGDERSVVLPSTDTVDFYRDRNGQGARYAAVTTERVRTVARNQFDCQTLPGAKLENQPTGISCFGDHWDEKFAYSSTMSGVIAPTENFMTPLTLALCEDSGWYSANYSMSRISPWGHGAGCDFVDAPCIVPDEVTGVTTVPDYGRGYFCTKGSQRGCSPAHTHKMACTVIDWEMYFPSVLPPEEYRYFTGEPALGGPKQADYCPVYGSTYGDDSAKELDCRNEDNSDFVNFYGEYYGENSMCFETSTAAGRCFQAQCVVNTRQLRVQISGTWLTCEEDFQELELKTVGGVLEGRLTCPRLAAVCPDLFCPVNCAGRGVCDFTNTDENGNLSPKCICYNETDTSPGCSASLVLDGKYIPDDSTLEDVIKEGFFDDLIAVFADNPETWDTKSWAWASALFVVFLLMLLCICSSFWPKKKKTFRRYA